MKCVDQSYCLPLTEPSSSSMTSLNRSVRVLPTILYTVLSKQNKVYKTYPYYPCTEPSSTSMTSLNRLIGVASTILHTVLSKQDIIKKHFPIYLPLIEPPSYVMTFLKRLLPTILYTVLTKPNRVYKTFPYYLSLLEYGHSQQIVERIVNYMYTVRGHVYKTFPYYLLFTKPSFTSLSSLNRSEDMLSTKLY